MIGKILLEKCLEGGGRWQKIPGMVLTIVRNNGRTLWPTIGIIKQLVLESSIGRVVIGCEYL